MENNEKKNNSKAKRGSCYCVAKWCNSNNVSCGSMFRLPKGNRGKEWLKQADRADLLDIDEVKLNRKYLCAKHFTKDCFLKSNLLTWNALPTIFDDYKFIPKPKIQNTLDIEVKKEPEGVKKLRPLLPAPTKRTTELENLFGETSSTSATPLRTSLAFSCNICHKETECIQKSKSGHLNLIIGKIDEGSVSRQPNDSVITITKGVNKSDVLKCDRKSKSFHSNEYKKECGKHPSNSKKDKVDSVSEREMMSDIEGLVSGQTYKDSMLPCSGCGEVFLMSSSLNQHQQRYHGEHFEN